jgi:hypothetical protein
LRFTGKPSSKGAAAALALLCVVGPILGYAHMLLVAHVQCVEHGELLHVAAAHTAVETHANAGRRTAEPSVDARSDVESESHEHDHCGVASARKTQAAVDSVRPVAVATVQPARPTSERAVECPPVALYVLAPKTSPPV